MKPALYEHTRVYAELRTRSGRVIVLDGRGNAGNIVSCETSKSFGDAAGTFTLTVKRRFGTQPSWLSQLDDPEDHWIYIAWYVNGHRTDGMWGLTDSISEGVTRGARGERTETVTITGRDHGKVFEKTPLFINIYEQGGAVLPVVPLYSAVAERLIGSPDEILRTLIDAWVGNNGINDKQWILPNGVGPAGAGGTRYFYDWCRYDTISTDLRGRMYAPTLLSTDRESVALWDVLQEYSNGVLNELWCDLVPISSTDSTQRSEQRMRPAIIARERPFPTIKSRARWDALPTHKIEPADVARRNLVSDGSTRFNYWQLEAIGLGGAGFATTALIQQATTRPPGQPGNTPIFDLDSIRRHGIRKWMQSTRYLPANESAEGGGAFWLSVASVWLRIIHDWYVVAPKQYTGTLITSRLRPEIRIGDRVFERRLSDGTVSDDGPWEEWEYYVEGVAHSFTYPREGRTTLTLTRGQPRGADYLRAQYQRYAGVDISTMHGDEEDEIIAAPTQAEEASAAGAGDLGVGTGTELAQEAPGDTGLRAEDGGGADAPIDGAARVVTPPDAAEEAPMTEADYTGGAPNVVDLGGEPIEITASLSDLDAAPPPRRPLASRSRRHAGSEGTPSTRRRR